MRYDVTVIGEMYQDHVFSGFAAWPRPGEEIFTDEYEWELGGGAVTTACALARLGRSVQLIGVAGKADMPRIAERLKQFDVDAQGIAGSEMRSGLTVSISTLEDRTFFTYRGANQELEQRLVMDEDLRLRIARAKHVHFAMPLSYSLLGNLLPAIREAGVTTSLDVGHHVGWLRSESSLRVMQAIDFTIPNEKEASLLRGSPSGYLELCRNAGVRRAVVKLGRQGALMMQDGQEYRAEAPDVRVIDTTGAGDAFDAGLIDALLEGATAQKMLESACVCGAMSTRAVGALSALPTRHELEQMVLESYVA